MVPLVLNRITLVNREFIIQIQGKTNLSHDGLNPAHVPFLSGEQSHPFEILLSKVKKSRHRRIKKLRRYGLLVATSQLSLW